MESMQTVMTSVCVLVIIVGFFGNLAAIITLCRRWSSLKSHEGYIIVLVFIDLILSFVAPMFRMNQLGVITFLLQSDFGCQLLSWLITTLNIQSAWIMTAIAVDRFTMIVLKPYSFRSSTNKRKILVINCAIFILASPAGVLHLYRTKLHPIDPPINRNVCFAFYSSATEDLIHSAIVFATQIVIPGFVLTILYTWMITRLRKPVDFQENTRSMQLRKRQHWKVIRLFLSILIIFYLLGLPYPLIYLIYTIHYNDKITWTRRKQEVFYYTTLSLKMMSYLNYCIDPFIYASFYLKGITGRILKAFSGRSPRTETG